MHERIVDGIFLVGGDRLSGPGDCMCYALDLGEAVLVDCGCGPGWPAIRANMVEAGLDPAGPGILVLTHCHVDHVGAAPRVARETGCRVFAHALDAGAIEKGDPGLTAAAWYGLKLEAMEISDVIQEHERVLSFPAGDLHILHAPGHTPGSCVAWLDTPAGRVLFGQDIHGPFDPSFGSDIGAFEQSMREVLALEADILCEGHFGVYRGRDEVAGFILDHVSRATGR